MNELTENQIKVLIENGNIDYKVDGSTDGIDLGKRRKYFSWLNSCSFVSDNGKIVKLVLKENTESQKVFFEAYVAWYDKYNILFCFFQQQVSVAASQYKCYDECKC